MFIATIPMPCTTNQVSVPDHCSPRNLRRVHNEIHEIQKSREALLSQAFQGSQRARAGKGHILLDQTTKGTLEAKGHSALL